MAVRDFLLEIGSEELPSAPLDKARSQLPRLMEAALGEVGLAHGAMEVVSSPRRLGCVVRDVACVKEAVTVSERGPKAQVAFDATGAPTKAALGFARSKGVAVEDLVVRDTKAGPYVFCNVTTPAQDAQELLGAVAEGVIAKLSWPKSQRWGSEHVRYGRPVRWIVCLFGPSVVGVRYGDVVSGRVTQGHRVLAPGWHEVSEPKEYKAVLERAFVLSHDERAQRIDEAIGELEERLGLRVERPQAVMDEVVNLCEWPTVIVGNFDERFLAIPQEIICESMLSHQRYFPCYDAAGKLSRTFVVVSNADPACATTIARGNKRVVRARLDDAAFFYNEDLKASMEAWIERLSEVTFQEKLGSVQQKALRMKALACEVARLAQKDKVVQELAGRAAYLAKADLVSQAVVEFTSQQGIMGGYYAAAAGEPQEVSLAIAEHYKPRFAGDGLPSSFVGRAVAIADKLDTICGMFAINEPPTGSKDPFAIRRGAIGVIRMLLTMPQVSLKALIASSLGLLSTQGLVFDQAKVGAKVANFFLARLAAMAKEEGVAPDIVAAIQATGVIDPEEFLRRAHSLETFRANETELMEDLAQAYRRATHLADPSLGSEVDQELLNDAERALFEAVAQASEVVSQALAANAFDEALGALAALRAPIDRFFEEVLVMAKEPHLRNNRLRLLNRFATLFDPVADIGALVALS